MELARLDLPDPFSYGAAVRAGLTARDVTQLVAGGEWVRLRRGWYSRPGPLQQGEEWERIRDDHLRRLRLALASRPGHVASHTSGALVHGLAVVVHPDQPVELTSAERAPRSRRYDGLVLHHSKTLPDELDVVDGLRVTSLVRTAADVVRTRTLPHGLGVVDDLLRRERLELPTLDRTLGRQRRWRGAPKGRAVLRLSDARRESWAESFSAGHLYLGGLPMPLMQVEIFDDLKRFLGRVDMLWPGSGLAGECDGTAKYFIPLPGATGQEETVLAHLQAERRRQQGMQDWGLRFSRWSPSQLVDQPEEVVHGIRRQLQQPCTFRGWVRVGDGPLRRLPFEADVRVPPLETLQVRRERRRR